MDHKQLYPLNLQDMKAASLGPKPSNPLLSMPSVIKASDAELRGCLSFILRRRTLMHLHKGNTAVL